VELPEPFRSALRAGRPHDVEHAPASTAVERYARGLARTLCSEVREAREDFEAALAELGPHARVELIHLDVRAGDDVAAAVAAARKIAAQAAPATALRARSLHVAALGEHKLRQAGPAMVALLEAAEVYRALGDRAARARVHDTMGMVYAFKGRLDHAMHCYALSLVDKAVAGDRPGMAITLGNLGRVHLRAGRELDALECFHMDLEIAEEIQDELGIVRMHGDIGRALLSRDDPAGAEARFRRCLELAERWELREPAFFARKDLALALVAQGGLDEAERLLDEAQRSLPEGVRAYLPLVLDGARGEWLLARGDGRAVAVLERAVRGFERQEVPDLEIPARISLARALMRDGLKHSAEQCLLGGLRRARHHGYGRYLRPLNEAMAALELVEAAVEETGRSIGSGPDLAESSYVLRDKLGSGAFGEVFRAYDPERGREVALKKLHLEQVYDPRVRERVLTTARLELEAASRVRHPGVVRVYAIGTEPGGGTYVVQEFVRGRPLSDLMPEDGSAELREVLAYAEKIAHALDALHAGGVVHRDLKPANVLVRDDGSPVLVDFGVAHVDAMAKGLGDGLAVGTLAYMAPEQAYGKKVDGRADLYALGVIIFEWLTGVLPLRPRGATFDDRAYDINRRPAPPLSDFRSGLAGGVAELVASLLEKKPRRRPKTAAQLAAACAELRGRLG
jgi:serine/threonine-protein kinase